METKTYKATATFPISRVEKFALDNGWNSEQDIDTFIEETIKQMLINTIGASTVAEIEQIASQQFHSNLQQTIEGYKGQLAQAIQVEKE